MDAVTISEVLIKRGKKICTSSDIKKIFKENYLSTISRLIKSKWLLPIKNFKGIYYVYDAEERQKRFRKLEGLEILISTLNRILGTEWYFGRVSALSLSGEIDQAISIYYVFNKKFSKEIQSKLLGEVVFVKTSAEFTGSCGITEKKFHNMEYRLCTMERNLTDYLYSYMRGHTDKEQIREFYQNYKISKEKLKILFKCYPKRSATRMQTAIEEATR